MEQILHHEVADRASWSNTLGYVFGNPSSINYLLEIVMKPLQHPIISQIYFTENFKIVKLFYNLEEGSFVDGVGAEGVEEGEGQLYFLRSVAAVKLFFDEKRISFIVNNNSKFLPSFFNQYQELQRGGHPFVLEHIVYMVQALLFYNQGYLLTQFFKNQYFDFFILKIENRAVQEMVLHLIQIVQPSKS